MALASDGRFFDARGRRHKCLLPPSHFVTRRRASERDHAAVIERFGRYPTRNATLGRASTPEELEYLSQPDVGW